MSFKKKSVIPAAVITTSILAAACASKGYLNGHRDPASNQRTYALPWEIMGPHGETYLPNVFYADPSENEQLMPLTIGNRYQIDHLIYPTIGNPHLYTHSKSDPRAEFMSVLRVEPDMLIGLYDASSESSEFFKVNPPDGVSRHSEPVELKLAKQGKDDYIKFFLVDRGKRGVLESRSLTKAATPGVFEIKPKLIEIDPLYKAMPSRLKARRTLRVHFSREQMDAIPDGFYDIRYEIAKSGELYNYEYQYNAVRVFEKGPESTGNRYTILNVTDSQVNPDKLFGPKTATRLEQFVQYVNEQRRAGKDPVISNAAFITFNGDLHNGGSPFNYRNRSVPYIYQREAEVILKSLKKLELPIFLTTGNHDGQAATNVPEWYREIDKHLDFIKGIDLHKKIEDVVDEVPSTQRNWPNYSREKFSSYLDEMEGRPSGKHVDIFTGAHAWRKVPVGQFRGGSWGDFAFEQGWKVTPEPERNMVIYDGFYQWQKTYGPLNASFVFGKNRYINVNTYELRQHRRAGWGLYTVNYGGNVSQTQMDWLTRELDRAAEADEDVTILTHHDPRGGHHGKDYPFYYRQVDYPKGFNQWDTKNILVKSTTAFLKGEVFCASDKWKKYIPGLNKDALDCMHDGLQEWMRADAEFDCYDSERIGGKHWQACDLSAFAERAHPWYSGYALIHHLATHPQIRTLLMGHTHGHELNILQSTQELIPPFVTLDRETQIAHEELDNVNPLRQAANEEAAEAEVPAVMPDGSRIVKRSTPEGAIQEALDTRYRKPVKILSLSDAGHTLERKLQGDRRELVILRMTTVADLTSQVFPIYGKGKDGKPYGYTMLGFTGFEVYAKPDDGRGYAKPQINTVHYYLNNCQGDRAKNCVADQFRHIMNFDLDRTTKIDAEDNADELKSGMRERNPLYRMFRTK